MLPVHSPIADRPTRRGGLFGRRRQVWSLILFVASFCFIVYVRSQPTTWNMELHNRISWRPSRPKGNWKTVDELKALLYLLTTSDEDLPDKFDVTATPLDLTVLAGGDNLEMAEWNQRIDVMDKFNPLIVFSKTYCPYSRKAKQLLETYDIHPPPRIIEVDLRHDSELIKSLLSRFTYHNTFPNILLHGKTLGGSDELHLLHEQGKLRQVLEAAGLSVGAEGDINVGVVNELVQGKDDRVAPRKGLSRRTN